MHSKETTVATALKVLLEGFIDYAGVFPPAAVPLDTAISNYKNYRDDKFNWMLRWLVVDGTVLEQIPEDLHGKVSILATCDDRRAASIETKSTIASQHPVYCEIATTDLAHLKSVKKSGCFAKIRTGGLKPEAIPSSADVAAFITACADLRLAFKATAGLHHPLRAEQALTYAADSPRAKMHGFINIMMSAAFAWNGQRDLVPIIEETEASAFRFDDEAAHWSGLSLTVQQIKESREQFFHSVGSCSFEEPVLELQALKWL